ncbi:MAG: molybdenum cofactor guanylyltransferase [Candidatus Omnitrophica bacterium]|nr:molybdenum cofactor guanylyltransferase [Candidatus Omnitrophota bacterium]MCB9719987.1 molybdenum cofactor guanylyltransferase [Candidatus Omnitrophota bacterium]
MGRPKASLPLGSGKPMIVHVYDILKTCCARVVLAGCPPDLPADLMDVPRIPDRIPDAGPIGGLEALLASGIDEEFLVVPCDLPLLQAETLRLLCAAHGKLPVVLSTAKTVQPLVARYGIGQLPEIRKQLDQGLYSLKALLHVVDHTRVPVPAQLADTLHNVNTIHDYTPDRSRRRIIDDG